MSALAMYKLVLLLLVHNVYALTTADQLVDIKNGSIRGVSSDNGQYTMYLGVPYAIVDHEDPFGPAQPHPGFNEVFDANNDSAVCPQTQYGAGEAIGTLDCLNINIHVPNTASSQNLLPVMVWIHGGGFAKGSGNREDFQANFLMKHDVIFVTMNYRLQIYGFMCLGTKEVPGNQGLKDQLLALRWINENIESFGGDASNITLIGESSGAMSTHLHILSPFERLFDRAIMQSGNWASPWSIAETDSGIAIRLSKQLGFETENTTEALSFLSKADPLQVVVAADALNPFADLIETFLNPCVESKFEGVENFVTAYPFSATAKKDKIMPIMIGFNSNELIFKLSNKDDEFYSGNFIERYLEFGFKSGNLTEMADRVRNFYIGNDTSGATFRDNNVFFGSDFLFNHPTERSLKRYIEDGADEIYYYFFSYNGGRNYYQVLNNITSDYAAHADDQGYLFVSDGLPEDVGSEEDFLIVDRMTTMWTNFAKFGNPTPQTSDILPVSWPQFSLNGRHLEINSELKAIERPFSSRMEFWDQFYEVYGDNQNGYEN